MYKKLLSLFLCLISVLFMNNPVLAIEKSTTVIDNYKPELTAYINLSETSEPLYLARERKSRDSGTGQMSAAWIGSIFIAGLGQMLLGDIGRGLLFMIGTGIGYLLFILPGLILHIWCIFDAYDMAKKQAEVDEEDEEARLIQEKLAAFENVLNKVSANDSKLTFNLANF